MKTKNFLFSVSLVILGGIIKVNSQVYSVPASAGTNGNLVTNIGDSAGKYMIGNNNVTLGTSCGQSTSANSSVTTGSQNTFIGARCALVNTTGFDNVFLGYQTALANVDGSYNTFLGRSSGAGNISGNNNTYVGYAAGYATKGNANTYLGRDAGWQNNGSNNVFLGYYAGRSSGTSSGNVFIGNSAGSLETNSNRLYIQNSGINTPLIYGEFDNKNLTFNVNAASGSRVSVSSFTAGSATLSSGLRLTNLKNTITPVANPSLGVLSVDANGDVIWVYDVVGTGAATTISNGANTSVTGNGTIASPYQIKAQTLYTNDGTITTSTGLRTVTMGNNNLFFNSAASTSGNGRVYIGNTMDAASFPPITATSNFRLLVEGGIMSERVKVSLRSNVANWADYVFANEYKLMPLNEVDAYVKENKHLPGIDSAEDLVKNGLDLGDMQAKQMGKIEELTLYIIDQNKALENQNKALEKQGKEIEELKAQVNALLGKK